MQLLSRIALPNAIPKTTIRSNQYIQSHTNTTALEINIFTSLALKIMQRHLQKPTSTKAKTETNNNKNTGHIYDFSLFLPCIPFNNRTNMFTFSNPKWWAVALFFWVFAICKIKKNHGYAQDKIITKWQNKVCSYCVVNNQHISSITLTAYQLQFTMSRNTENTFSSTYTHANMILNS